MSALARAGRTPAGAFGLIVVGAIIAVALVSLVWTPFPPYTVDSTARWASPSWPHLLGTDNTGRDILSLVMVGARTAILVAVGSSAIAVVFGLAMAALGALTARWIRESVAVLIDILVAFPVLLIAMMLSAVWGGSLWGVAAAVGLGFGVNIARVTRPELRRIAASDFVLAARASGLTGAQTLRRHLLPNIVPILIVQVSWGMGVAVLAEAGLSYLGFGASVTDPSWGLLLAELQKYISVHPLSVLWPGLAITLAVLAFNLLGDALRDATDPTLTPGERTGALPQTPGVVA